MLFWHATIWNYFYGLNQTRSNLSKANEQRNYHIFDEYAYFMVEQARKKRQAEIFKLGGFVYAFDSTTIDLCFEMFEWAKFSHHKGDVKMHTFLHYSFFVTLFQDKIYQAYPKE
ncbi:MAG: hypothetical protein BGN96_02300 [Bacteroidales bacterium 45-6]|nr:MAG: hypothetical protein BGN96_02300 [Bacteroidales bacterium 45-6]